MKGVYWSPGPCLWGLNIRFIQVGQGGSKFFNDYEPFVDNGSHSWGWGAPRSTGSALYPIGQYGVDIFQDTPSGLAGDVRFEVCRVCLCENKVINFGPCKIWKRGDSGDLSSHSGGYATQQFINTVNKEFPGTLGTLK